MSSRAGGQQIAGSLWWRGETELRRKLAALFCQQTKKLLAPTRAQREARAHRTGAAAGTSIHLLDEIRKLCACTRLPARRAEPDDATAGADNDVGDYVDDDDDVVDGSCGGRRTRTTRERGEESECFISMIGRRIN